MGHNRVWHFECPRQNNFFLSIKISPYWAREIWFQSSNSVKFPHLGDIMYSKALPRGQASWSISCGYPTPPPPPHWYFILSYVAPNQTPYIKKSLSRVKEKCFLFFSFWGYRTWGTEPIQGLYRSWKTWKVMEFYDFIFQAWKVMEFECWSLKVMENDADCTK